MKYLEKMNLAVLGSPAVANLSVSILFQKIRRGMKIPNLVTQKCVGEQMMMIEYSLRMCYKVLNIIYTFSH